MGIFAIIWGGMKVFGLGALEFFKKIPWQGWLALAAAFVIGWHLWGDRSRLREARKEADKAGYSRAMFEVEARALRIEAKVKALDKSITTEIRNRNNEEARHIATTADNLRVRGPGAARCNVGPAVPGSAGGRNPADRGANATPAGVPVEVGVAAVPWNWLVDRAEKCDVDRAEVISWREWHDKWGKAWVKLGH